MKAERVCVRERELKARIEAESAHDNNKVPKGQEKYTECLTRQERSTPETLETDRTIERKKDVTGRQNGEEYREREGERARVYDFGQDRPHTAAACCLFLSPCRHRCA